MDRTATPSGRVAKVDQGFERSRLSEVRGKWMLCVAKT